VAAESVRAEAEDVTPAQTVTIGLRHDMRVGKRPEAFASASYSRDRLDGILGRTTGEVGSRMQSGFPARTR
jgi:hypothetical protein